MKKFIYACLVFAVCICMTACGKTVKLNSEKAGDLWLWDGKYMNGDYYAFDGMSLTYSEDSFKGRSCNVGGVSSYEDTYNEDNGWITNTYSYFYSDESQGIERIDIHYSFTDGKFASGTVSASFDDYNKAKDYVNNITADLSLKEDVIKDIDKQREKNEYYGWSVDNYEEDEKLAKTYVDEAGGYLSIRADKQGEKGVVEVRYCEIVNMYNLDKSRYFKQ
ncbi:MAG: hypothetical protein K5858_07380 [Lachnospiraceae bacterium]|nr:hypothetical protein [Lachnospiraceae bacterium]